MDPEETQTVRLNHIFLNLGFFQTLLNHFFVLHALIPSLHIFKALIGFNKTECKYLQTLIHVCNSGTTVVRPLTDFVSALLSYKAHYLGPIVIHLPRS